MVVYNTCEEFNINRLSKIEQLNINFLVLRQVGEYRDGYGVQNWPDGAVYEGQWKEDKVGAVYDSVRGRRIRYGIVRPHEFIANLLQIFVRYATHSGHTTVCNPATPRPHATSIACGRGVAGLQRQRYVVLLYHVTHGMQQQEQLHVVLRRSTPRVDLRCGYDRCPRRSDRVRDDHSVADINVFATCTDGNRGLSACGVEPTVSIAPRTTLLVTSDIQRFLPVPIGPRLR